MPPSAHPYPGRCLLRAVWSVERLPADYLRWRRENIRQALAYHEAGHALLMHGFGVAGIEARLSPDGCDGEVFHKAGIHAAAPRVSLSMERTGAVIAAAIYHAGIEAEQMVGGFVPAIGSEWRCPGTTDHEKAHAAFGDLFFRGKPHGYAKAMARAALLQNREALDLIARQLYYAGAWRPADTPQISIRLGDASRATADACLAYGEPAHGEAAALPPQQGQGGAERDWLGH